MTDLPILSYYYSKHDEYGHPIRGHKNRVQALLDVWELRGGKTKKLTSADDVYWNDFVLVDTWERGIKRQLHGRVISITDTETAPVDQSDIVINHNLAAHELDFRYTWATLLGPSYFISGKFFEGLRVLIGGHIVLIPGGAEDEFWKRVSRKVVGDLAYKYGLGVQVVTGYSPSGAATIMAKAKFVVAAASTSFLEAKMLGKHVMGVNTTGRWDQVTNLRESPLDETYDPTKLDHRLSAGEFHRKKQAPFVSNHGTYNVINQIVRLANEYQNNS